MIVVVLTMALAAACAPAATPTPQVVTKVETQVVVVTPTTPPPAPLPDEIKMGPVASMTGSQAAGGELAWSGVQIAHDMHPTVLGRPMRVILLDSKSDRVEAATAATRLIEQNKIVALLGDGPSGINIAMSAITEKAGIPQVASSATNPLVTQGKKWVFRICFIDSYQGYVLAKYALETLKAKSVVVFQEVSDDYSVGLALAFRDSWIKLGGSREGLHIVSATTGEVEFGGQVSYTKTVRPHVILVTTFYEMAALVIRQVGEAGLTMPILGGDSLDFPVLVDLAGKAAMEDVTFPTHYHPDAFVGSTVGKAFVEEYKKRTGQLPPTEPALCFDHYMVVLDAIERAGSVEPEAIRKALEETKNFEGAAGYITIDSHHNAIKPAVMLQYRDGKSVFLTVVAP